MSDALGLTVGNRYSLITLIFFIPYVLFQPVATVVLRKVGPRYFLSAIVIAWGVTMIVSLSQHFSSHSNATIGLRLRPKLGGHAGS